MPRVSYGRHSFKVKGKDFSVSGLSPKGVSAALRAGRRAVRTTRNPDGTLRTVKHYAGQSVDLGKLSGDSLRTLATAEMHRQGLIEGKGKVAMTKNRKGELSPTAIRLRKDFGFGLAIKDKATCMKVLETKYGNNEKLAYDAWIAGKDLFNGSMISPRAAVKQMTKSIALAIRAERMGRKDFELSNHTHSWYVDALVEELTGKSIDSFKPAGLVRENERAMVDIKGAKTATPQVFVKYRGKTFNVTKALAEKFPNVLKGKF